MCTLQLFPIRLTPHSRVAHRYLGTPSLLNKNQKFSQNGILDAVRRERVKALKEKESSSAPNEEVQPGSDSDCSIEDSVNGYYVSDLAICSDDDVGDGNPETCISGNTDDAPEFRQFPTLSRSDNATWHPSTDIIDWYKVR